MKLMVAATCAAVIGIALSGSAAAQTAPGLDETLSYISDQIAQQGESELTINNVDPATGQTWANHSTQLGSNFSTDPAHKISLKDLADLLQQEECRARRSERLAATRAVTEADIAAGVPYR